MFIFVCGTFKLKDSLPAVTVPVPASHPRNKFQLSSMVKTIDDIKLLCLYTCIDKQALLEILLLALPFLSNDKSKEGTSPTHANLQLGSPRYVKLETYSPVHVTLLI